ncbi:MAG: hypothetical protein OMM_04759 [Candidatus Magnetoglobus multicellularis str. Araruama]|uniref:Uncharacterized protein n=2 Tax=Candidatus Magnetoglobus multicellularis str. Araruama TaxID=890399 RepID=A0A1V1NZY4_9BACT|nr:MAG: hypothetical protein OMM_04759 [Candidatus Magnetoglobus multicellularis str. Araruama]
MSKANLSYEGQNNSFEYFKDHPLDMEYIKTVHSGRYNERNIHESLSEELENKVVEHHLNRLNRELIEPIKQKLHDNSIKANELLEEEKKKITNLEKQRRKVTPKIETIIDDGAKEKIPWEMYKIVLCTVAIIIGVTVVVWATINARNMAISSFPMFAANPGMAWGIGLIYLGVALVLEVGPEFLKLDERLRKIYHIVIVSITALDVVIWCILFSKTAGLMGEGDGISVDLNSLLEAPPELLGMDASTVDFIFTAAQTSLEFLIPSILFMYVNYEYRQHIKSKPYVSIEDNPSYVSISSEIDKSRTNIGNYSESVNAIGHFERLIPKLEKEYSLNAASALSKLHVQKQQSATLFL